MERSLSQKALRVIVPTVLAAGIGLYFYLNQHQRLLLGFETAGGATAGGQSAGGAAEKEEPEEQEASPAEEEAGEEEEKKEKEEKEKEQSQQSQAAAESPTEPDYHHRRPTILPPSLA